MIVFLPQNEIDKNLGAEVLAECYSLEKGEANTGTSEDQLFHLYTVIIILP